MNEIITARLKQSRIDRNLKQSDVAEVLGVKKNTISNWEQGKSNPDIDTLVELCMIYGISYTELLEEAYGSIGKETDEKSRELLSLFYRLNCTGKEEALKRVGELTYLKQYAESSHPDRQDKTKVIYVGEDKPHLTVRAAHMMDDATAEQIEHDNNLMGDDSIWND